MGTCPIPRPPLEDPVLVHNQTSFHTAPHRTPSSLHFQMRHPTPIQAGCVRPGGVGGLTKQQLLSLFLGSDGAIVRGCLGPSVGAERSRELGLLVLAHRPCRWHSRRGGCGSLSPPHMACRAGGRTCPLPRPVWGEWAPGLFLTQSFLDPRPPPSGGLIVCDWGSLGHSSGVAG